MRAYLPLLALLLLPLAACDHDPLKVQRTGCPAVAVPTYAGEVTRFSPADSRDASAIDLVASMSRVRGVCQDSPTEGRHGGELRRGGAADGRARRPGR